MSNTLTDKISKSLIKTNKKQFKNIADQTWEVVYSYFKNYPNWMARHQLDSYNDFIHNNIPRIFKQKGYYKVLSYRGDYAHIFEIYLGGKEHNKIRISHPTIYDHQSGNMRPLYPNEARLKNLTYGFDLFYDVDVVLNVYQGDNNENHIIKDYTFPDADYLKDIYMGNIPIMLHSDICVLNKIPKANLMQYGENPDEPGGYLILDGAEKVILCQQRKAENTIFLSKIKESQSDKYKHQALIKSKHDEAFEFARDNCLYMENTGELVMRIGPIGKEFIRPMTSPEFQGYNNKYIPVFVLFRYLGVESDKDILNLICGDNLEESDLTIKLANELIPSIQDRVIMQFNIYDKQSAELLLSKLERTRTQLSGGRELTDISRNKVQTLAYLHQSIKLNFLPHAGEDHKQKAYYLAYMVRRLLLNYLNIDETGNTSLDTFMAKRIDTGGYLLSTLFRTTFIEGILYNIRRQIDRILELNPDMRGPDSINVINENSYRTIFSVDSFNMYFTNKLKVGVFGNKTGVVQQLERVNYFSVISHLRRIVDPTFGGKSTVTDDRRQLNTTQFGYLCPNESPEGGNIGLRQALSILTTISIGYPTKQLKQWCFKNGVVPLTYNTNANNHEQVKVFVNGSWLGCHPNPVNFVKVFKLYRRNGLLNATTSIAFYPLIGEIQIYCDDGRLVRPLYCVENNELLINDKEFNDVYSNNLRFDDLCTSRLIREQTNNKLKPWSLRDTLIYTPKRLGLSDDDTELIEKLELNQALVEYLDPYESDTTLININLPMPDISFLQKSKLSYTHSEIHPATMLGVMAHVSPCTQHSQGGKYLASGGTKHPKQSLSVYHPCHDTRFDTGKIFLAHNVERPIVHGRMNTKINHHKWGTGQNIIIAIAYYNEDNQEDSIIFNKSSLDMGLFHSSYYKTYEAHEVLEEKTGLEEKFYNPYYRNENENYPDSLTEQHGSYTYEHLDKFGYVKEGTYLTGNEVLIGKFLKIKNAFGEETYEDLSTHVKKDNIESYVDKVYTCTTNSKGLRLCKVRTCQFRKPEHGDKFACYTDTTEVLTDKGWINISQVTLNDTVAVLKDGNKVVFEHPEDLIQYDYSGKLYNLESEYVNITVTPEHKMYVKRCDDSQFELQKAQDCYGLPNIYYKTGLNIPSSPFADILINKNETVTESWVEYTGKVYCLTVSSGVFYVRQNKKAIWCGNSRNGQKGTIGLMIPDVDMPFTDDGIIPDIILHPSSYPKRMTISQLMELIFAELGVNMGFFPQANTMENIEMSEIIKIMENAGVSYCGDKVLYNGVYGNQMKSAIFMGPMYFQRSILQTRDKINARGGEHRVDGIPVPGGGYTAKERQVVSGRANGGGVKIGEMERDSLLAHGITSFINERDTTRGDKFFVYVSPITGEMMIGNPDDKLFFDNSVDGPISYHLKEGTGQGRKHIIGPNMFHKKQHKFVKVQIPYAMKLVLHDFMGMGMSLRLNPEIHKLVYDKYVAGEDFENLLLEYDDIIQKQDAKMEEYLQQSLVEQLAKEKAESKLTDTDDNSLQDINEQVESQRQEKIDALSALNQPENDYSDTQQRYALDKSSPQPYSPLQAPDIGQYTLDGVDTKTTVGPQEFGVIDLASKNSASSPTAMTMGNLQQGGFNISNSGSRVAMLDNLMHKVNNANNMGSNNTGISANMGLNNMSMSANMGMNTDMGLNNRGMHDGMGDMGMNAENVQTGGVDNTMLSDFMSLSGGGDELSAPEIGFSDLDDMETVYTGGAYNDITADKSIHTGGSSPDVKQVVFNASEKEKLAMGL